MAEINTKLDKILQVEAEFDAVKTRMTELEEEIKVTRPSFFGGVPSYFEALWYPHLYFYRKSNT